MTRAEVDRYDSLQQWLSLQLAEILATKLTNGQTGQLLAGLKDTVDRTRGHFARELLKMTPVKRTEVLKAYAENH